MNAFISNVVTPPIADGWLKPNSIETKVPDVAPMTRELTPEPLREWLADISHRMQTPADFATVSAITVIGSIIGSGCSIRPKQKDDWEVIPNLWGACIGRPSVVLKSPSMNEPRRMVDRLQAEYGVSHGKLQASFEADTLISEMVIKDIENQMKKAVSKTGQTPQAKSDGIAILHDEYTKAKAVEESRPPRRLFKTNETSIQAMTVLQNENERGVLVFRDELTGLLARWDRDDQADERAYYLEGWNGNGTYTDTKIGRGLTDAKNICISLLGGIQPDKLKRYLYQAMKGNNDGLMQRLQLAVYPDLPNDWVLVDVYPNKEEKQRVYDLIAKLAELDFIEYGATQTDYDDRPYFRFNTDAQELFNEWLTQLQLEKISNEDNPLMLEHYGKFRSLMPSLALIFHCIDISDGKATGDVSVTAAKLAIDWCTYLESHSRRIYAMAESPEYEAAISLSQKIKGKQLPSPFTAKIVYRKGWHGLKDREQVEAACSILIDENWLAIEYKEVGKLGGRPPLPDYQINPVFF